MMSRPRLLVFSALALLSFFLFTAERRRAVRPPSNPLAITLDARRSFAVTDQAILDGFSFERVVTAIVERSGVSMRPALLIQQLLDTQNPKPGLISPGAPHCDDFLTNGQPSFNGVIRHCPTPQGVFAERDPFLTADYVPLGIFNRFDQTPPDGANCGQYRIIFAKRLNGGTPSVPERFHFIFEAVLPNPNPAAGLAGCRPVAEFWATLSNVDSAAERRAKLETFFFTGLPGFEPVFDPSHYTLESGGGIRTVQVAGAGGSSLAHFFQFRLAKRNGSLIAEPDVLENMPLGTLFDARVQGQAGRDFRDEFIRQVANLAINDVNRMFVNIPRQYLMAENDPADVSPLGIPSINYNSGLQSPDGVAFRDRIDAELKRIGSTLRPQDIITRVETQGCVICHAGSGNIGGGLRFPNALLFQQHVDESLTENGEAGPRFQISPAMKDFFIPHRMEILKNFLATGAAPVHSQ